MQTRIVKCPNCGKSTEYSPNNPYRPFCSERCRLIDLGQWADEKYTIPVKGGEASPRAVPQESPESMADDHEDC